MKKVSDLKPGDKIYDLDYRQVKWYTYFCVHPRHSNYHILIDAAEEPIRVYEPKLQMILDQGFNSYDDVLLALANKMEEQARDIKTEIAMREK